MNCWTKNSLLKDINFKATHIMPSLLLQKPSKASKAKNHLKALERRIDLWSNGILTSFYLREKQFNHVYITSSHKRSIGELSKTFAILTEKGNVKKALKLLASNISNGILPVDYKTFKKSKISSIE